MLTTPRYSGRCRFWVQLGASAPPGGSLLRQAVDKIAMGMRPKMALLHGRTHAVPQRLAVS
jgi:hypothetical protein